MYDEAQPIPTLDMEPTSALTVQFTYSKWTQNNNFDVRITAHPSEFENTVKMIISRLEQALIEKEA